MTAQTLFATWLARGPTPWTPRARHIARDTLRDAIACLAAGSIEPVTRKVAAALLPADGLAGRCTLVGFAPRAPAPWAALINGTAAHALDFDDNHTPAMAHASAVLLPALLAAGEARASGGGALIDAFLAGLELMAGLGYGLNPVHRQRGWHATSTIGALGAAGAVARLWRLDAMTCQNALGIACSLSGGSMQQFGTDTKPLHAGLAAQAGVLAAQWAASGVSAAGDALDGPFGLQRLLVGSDLEALRAQGTGFEAEGFNLRFSPLPEEPPHLVERWPPVLKRWPNCASAHPAMQLAVALRRRHAPRDDDRLEVRTRTAYLANLRYTDPLDAAQARFSLEHGVALAWWTGGAVLEDFETHRLSDAAWRGRMQRVRRAELGPEAVPSLEAELVLLRHDGSRHAVSLHDGELDGDSGRPIPEVDLQAKFHACMRRAGMAHAAAAVEHWLAQPHDHSVAALGALLRGADDRAVDKGADRADPAH